MVIARIIFIGVILLIPAQVFAAWDEVAGRKATCEQGNVGNLGCATVANVTSGNQVLAFGTTWETSTHTLVITDTRSSSYTIWQGTARAGSGGFYRTFIACAVLASSGANTVDVNPSTGGAYISMTVNEYSGGTCDLDVNGNDSTGTDVTASDTLTTTFANSAIFGVVSHFGSVVTITPGVNYTQVGEVEGTDNNPHNAVHRFVTTAQLYTVDWTLGDAREFNAQTVSLKEAVVGGHPTMRRWGGVYGLGSNLTGRGGF